MQIDKNNNENENENKNNKNPSMIRHAVMMMAGTLMSRVLGLAREILVAAYFGATGSMDAFNVAYRCSRKF